MRMMTGAAALLLGLLAAGCNGELVGGGMRPAAVLLVSGDLQTGTVGQELPQPLVVKVVDDAGDPVPSQLVNFRVIQGGGSVFAGSALTNSDGIAQERWTLGPVAGDTQRVEARAVDPTTGEAITFAVFRAIGISAAPAQVTADSTYRNGTAGAIMPQPLTVRVVDANGNGVPGTSVAWTVAVGGGSLMAETTTDATGRARATWTLGGLLGVWQVARATVAGVPPAQFQALARSPTPLELVQVGGIYQGGSVNQPLSEPIVVELRQAGTGQPVPGAWVRGYSSASPDSALTDVNGRASFTWTLDSRVGWQSHRFDVLGANASREVTAYGAAAAPTSVTATPEVPYVRPGYNVRVYARVNGGSFEWFPVRATVEAGGGSVTSTMAYGGIAELNWRVGPGDGSTQRIRVRAGSAETVLEIVNRDVWLLPLLEPNSIVTDGTWLTVKASDVGPYDEEPGPTSPRMYVTVDGRTTEFRTELALGLGYRPWISRPAYNSWVAGLTPGPKVARFRLETTRGSFELDWPFTYQP